jgi:Domain of unknown function (DUF4160)
VPTVLRLEGFRFFFFSNERNEPVHIHVEKQSGYAKFWLQPVRLARSRRFDDPTLSKLHRMVRENEALFLEGWNEHFAR